MSNWDASPIAHVIAQFTFIKKNFLKNILKKIYTYGTIKM